jgi:mannitol/fructose-specific phosphotransferase system IIA component (Ntr-type)
MLLQDIFSVDSIKIGLESDDKDECFEELVDIFIASSPHNASRKDALGAIREREAKMSTGIKKGIAVPHGKLAAMEGVHGVIGVSKKGIDYDALDGEPVYLLFLLLSSPEDSEQHLRALKRLAQLLENPDFYNDVMKASSPQEIRHLLQRYEDILSQRD